VFIRAPRIVAVGPGVEVIARRGPEAGARAGEPVGVRSGRLVGICFHPELTSDLRFHRWFLTEVAGLRLPGGATPAAHGAAVARGAGS
jgi:5'-phosphate synthase pdxT subunit